MNRSILIILIIAIFALGGLALLGRQKKSEKETVPVIQTPVATNAPANVEYTASFAIFTNGTFREFSSVMYHNLSRDVFIDANNPNLVIVKKSGTTWDDFFATLPFKLNKKCLTTGTGQTFCTSNSDTLRFYLNGKEDPNALDKVIDEGDKLLITYGNENEEQIKLQLQKIPSSK